LDPRDLDELLTEMTLISARTELYKHFLLKSITIDLSGLDQKSPQITNLQKLLEEAKVFMNNCNLRCSVQELIGDYSILENYFMTENINKAIQMNTGYQKGSLTSSIVDDTFFIIKKCLKRSLCSDSVDGCCVMFNNCSAVIDSTYKDYFHSMVKQGYPTVSDLSQALTAIQRRFQNPDLTERQKIDFLITLNNIDESIECINTIRKLFEEDIINLFQAETQQSKDKLISCLNDLNSVSSRFKELLNFGFKQLNQNEVKPRIKQWCDVYSTTLNHILNEDDINQFELSDPFVQNFIKNVDQMVNLFKEYLTIKNQESLISSISNEISVYIEKNLLKCSFNKLGGLQFDKEMRILINYLTSLTSWSSGREKFARLSQFAILLSLETIDELYEYWNSSLGITWRLTPNEIRQVLTLRVDFKSEDVKKLKL
jgi:conserved oligomeric Golgi complex subunit 4